MLGANIKALQPAASILLALSIREVEAPGVERADDLVARDDSVSERAAPVRALVFNGMNAAIAHAEDRNRARADHKRAANAFGKLIERAKTDLDNLPRRLMHCG